MTARARECPEAVRVGRLKKAVQFHDGAVLLGGDMPDASVALMVDAGIASADAVCCARLGKYSSSDNHNDAVALLGQADPTLEKYLRTLLGLKHKIAYTHQPASADDLKKATRAASALVEAARRTSAIG